MVFYTSTERHLFRWRRFPPFMYLHLRMTRFSRESSVHVSDGQNHCLILFSKTAFSPSAYSAMIKLKSNGASLNGILSPMPWEMAGKNQDHWKQMHSCFEAIKCNKTRKWTLTTKPEGIPATGSLSSLGNNSRCWLLFEDTCVFPSLLFDLVEGAAVFYHEKERHFKKWATSASYLFPHNTAVEVLMCTLLRAHWEDFCLSQKSEWTESRPQESGNLRHEDAGGNRCLCF